MTAPSSLPETGALTGHRTAHGDFILSAEELREITAFTVAAAREALSIFEDACPTDPRPRQAIEAAQLVVDGATRSRIQRLAAPAAHRAAKLAPSAAAYHAAMAAGDAGASMYLHPLARASQVAHILRAPAHAACAWEHAASHGSSQAALERAVERATPMLMAVLMRYPRAANSTSRVSDYMAHLDAALRDAAVGGNLGSGARA
ncbi:putative immunity protein [Lacisediminihabitans sp.]|uniref:putative immunity protein n=1 Tax=Lacisediminihabitans sp. TaxID=2787631 RepID=UPI0039C8D42A